MTAVLPSVSCVLRTRDVVTLSLRLPASWLGPLGPTLWRSPVSRCIAPLRFGEPNVSLLDPTGDQDVSNQWRVAFGATAHLFQQRTTPLRKMMPHALAPFLETSLLWTTSTDCLISSLKETEDEDSMTAMLAKLVTKELLGDFVGRPSAWGVAPELVAKHGEHVPYFPSAHETRLLHTQMEVRAMSPDTFVFTHDGVTLSRLDAVSLLVSVGRCLQDPETLAPCPPDAPKDAVDSGLAFSIQRALDAWRRGDDAAFQHQVLFGPDKRPLGLRSPFLPENAVAFASILHAMGPQQVATVFDSIDPKFLEIP